MSRKSTTLSGTRVCLRPPVAGDYREFAALMRRSRAFHRGRVNPFNGTSQFAEYITQSRTRDCFRLLICRKPDGVVVGSISLFHIVREGLQSGVVGYLVGASHCRQGFATEALRLMLRFAFQTVKLHRVEANIQPRNVASIALVRRCGFQREGLSPRYLKVCGKWRDHERWAILVEDWRRLPIR